MVEMHPEVQEDLNETAIKEREALIKQKQYEFEKGQIQENKEKLGQKSKRKFKDYLMWVVVFLVVVVLILLLFVFDLI